MSASSRPSLLGVTLQGDRTFFFFSLLVLGAMLWFLARLRSSRFGRGLVLVGTDRQVASTVGVSPWRAKIFAFALAGLCAGVAGALTATLYTTPPNPIGYTTFNSLFFLAIPVLAGFRSLVGVAAAAVAFVMVPQALEPYRISPFTLGALALLGGTLLGRGGLSGLVLDRARRFRRSRSGTPPAEVRTVAELAAGAGRAGREDVHRRALAVLEGYFPHRRDGGGVLAARRVSVAFGGVQALRDVSITVPAGQLVGLLGPNGSGKSTLFDVINGLRAPDAGEVFLDGRDVTATRAWDRAALGLSRTFQANRLDLDLPVAENLLAGAYTTIPGNFAESIMLLPRARAGTQRARAAAWAVAELLDIEHYWDEPAGQLSFGNRRRVEIGRSLMSAPRVLLLDEPSAGLDPAAARALFELVHELHRNLGLAVLLVEHHVRAVLEHCDLVYVLSQRGVVVGTPAEVAGHPDVRSQYLGPDFDLRVAAGG